MTAATAINVTTTSATLPRAISRKALVLAAAIAVAIAGAIMAPFVALVGLVLGVALVGLIQVGTAIDRTFDSLVALGS